jgi:CheY-like chemotaxis protein
MVNQKLARRLLEKLGYTVEVVENGRMALQAASTGAYSAILMDCQMPLMDGYAATGGIRKLPGNAARVPIIALTASALKGDREKCLEAGMTDFLTKPVKLDELSSALRRWCGSTHPLTPPKKRSEWDDLLAER